MLTAAVIEQIEELLAQGVERGAAAPHLGVKPNTVAKPMRAGRVREKGHAKLLLGNREGRFKHSIPADCSPRAGEDACATTGG